MIGVTFDEAKRLVLTHKLPKSSECDPRELWKLADDRGWTVAHVAAKHGLLPANFDQWDMAITEQRHRSRTVAHIAAENGTLPDGFDRWELATDTGWTVAHEATFYGGLPADFDRWELANNKGLTVGKMAVKHKIITEEYLHAWSIRRQLQGNDEPPCNVTL
jgi:hypothetical protein